MNYKLLLIALSTIAVTSCTTAYKAGQTPDDVYYSPARAIVDNKEDEKNERNEDLAKTEEDQYLKMKVRNRGRWGTIDDYDYWYDSRYPHCVCNHRSHNEYAWNNWHYGYNRPYGNYYYNSGYYGGYPVVINKYVPKASNVNRPSLEGYNNKSYNNSNSLGNTIKKVFNNTNTSTNSNSNRESTYSNSTPSRTYNPSSSSSSSSSSRTTTTTSSSSSGSGVSRPARGN
jgi:hypothetical protein